MMLSLLYKLSEIIIGFAGGVAVGIGFVAFLTVLKIIPRLIQLSNTHRYTNTFSYIVVGGVLFGSIISFFDLSFNQHIVVAVLVGLFQGVFNGMLAAAVTEVLNVFPIIFKRIRAEQYVLILLMALVLGKIAGSLFQWLIFVK